MSSGPERDRQDQEVHAEDEGADREPAFAFGLPFSGEFRRLLLFASDRRFGGHAASQVVQDLGRRPITLGGILLGHPLNDVREIAWHSLQHAINLGQAAVGRRMPHHPRHLFVATKHVQAGEQSREILAAHHFERGEAERIQNRCETGPGPNSSDATSGAIYLVVPFTTLPCSPFTRRQSRSRRASRDGSCRPTDCSA